MDTPGQDLYFLGVLSLGLSSLLTAINIIATTLYMRTPGLTLRRLPVFVWSMLVTSVLNLIWVPVIGVAVVMGLLDRLVPTNFFSAQGRSEERRVGEELVGTGRSRVSPDRTNKKKKNIAQKTTTDS